MFRFYLRSNFGLVLDLKFYWLFEIGFSLLLQYQTRGIVFGLLLFFVRELLSFTLNLNLALLFIIFINSEGGGLLNQLNLLLLHFDRYFNRVFFFHLVHERIEVRLDGHVVAGDSVELVYDRLGIFL